MLSIARALMSRPQLLLLDEPSLGLAPMIVKQIFAVIRELNKAGVTIFLVEQNAFHALKIATPRLCHGQRQHNHDGERPGAAGAARGQVGLPGGRARGVTMRVYDDGGGWAFLLITLLIGGAAGFLSGRAIAQTWRPFWQLPLYMLGIAAGVRFCHYALFGEILLSLKNFAVDYAVALRGGRRRLSAGPGRADVAPVWLAVPARGTVRLAPCALRGRACAGRGRILQPRMAAGRSAALLPARALCSQAWGPTVRSERPPPCRPPAVVAIRPSPPTRQQRQASI